MYIHKTHPEPPFAKPTIPILHSFYQLFFFLFALSTLCLSLCRLYYIQHNPSPFSSFSLFVHVCFSHSKTLVYTLCLSHPQHFTFKPFLLHSVSHIAVCCCCFYHFLTYFVFSSPHSSLSYQSFSFASLSLVYIYVWATFSRHHLFLIQIQYVSHYQL